MRNSAAFVQNKTKKHAQFVKQKDVEFDSKLIEHFQKMLKHDDLENTQFLIVLSKIDLANINCNFKYYAVKLGIFDEKINETIVRGYVRQNTINHKIQHKQLSVLRNDLLSLFSNYLGFVRCDIGKNRSLKFITLSNKTNEGPKVWKKLKIGCANMEIDIYIFACVCVCVCVCICDPLV